MINSVRPEVAIFSMAFIFLFLPEKIATSGRKGSFLIMYFMCETPSGKLGAVRKKRNLRFRRENFKYSLLIWTLS